MSRTSKKRKSPLVDAEATLIKNLLPLEVGCFVLVSTSVEAALDNKVGEDKLQQKKTLIEHESTEGGRHGNIYVSVMLLIAQF